MAPLTRSTVRWRLAHIGLTGRVFFGTASIVAVVILAAFIVAAAQVRTTGEAAARRGLEQSADLVAQFLSGRSRSLAGGARVFVQGPYFRTLVAEQRRDDILDQAFEASEQLGADWVFITDERGTLLAKSDEPAVSGTPMGTVPLVAGALRGLVTSGFGISRDSLLFQAVAVPIQTPSGAPLGVLVATRLVDSLLVRDVKATTSSDLLFYVQDVAGRRRLSVSTFAQRSGVRGALGDLATPPATTGSQHPDVVLDGVPYLAQGSTLTTAGGDVIGGFVVLRSRDAELTGIATLRRSLAIAGLIGLFLSWLAAFAAARSIARPVRALAAVVRRAAEGRYVAGADDVLATVDSGAEMQELGSAFVSLMTDLRDKDALTGLTPSPAPSAVTQAPDAAAHSRGSRQVVGGIVTRGAFATRPGFAMSRGAVLANRYVIDSVVGSGGLGIVYRARDRVVGEPVAIKVLRPELLDGDPGARARLVDELRVARHISHRNVVRVHDLGEADGITFLTMEYVDGASLQTVIDARGALPAVSVLSIARQLLRALAVIHAEQVVHGDLKPANVLLGPSGVLKVTDFGIARVAGRRAPAGAMTHTQLAGATVGTPEYMAPELLIGGAPSVASDIYAAGVVLHECLRGETPFDAETRLTFLAHKLDASTTPPAPTHVASADAGPLAQVIATMMAPRVSDRPLSATALLEALSPLS